MREHLACIRLRVGEAMFTPRYQARTRSAQRAPAPYGQPNGYSNGYVLMLPHPRLSAPVRVPPPAQSTDVLSESHCLYREPAGRESENNAAMKCPHCDAHPADGSWFCPCCFRTLAGRRRRRGSGPVVAVCGIAVALGLGALVGGFTGFPGGLSSPAHVESGLAAP